VGGVCALLSLAPGCTKPKSSRSAQQAATTSEDPKLHLTGGELVFSDDFSAGALSDAWRAETPAWRVENGALAVKGARNMGCWYTRDLPERVRVEFDATSLSPEGDLKFEIFGTKAQHQAGYVGVFGGWKNSVSIIARLDEHGDDRLESRARKVEKGKRYRFAVVRHDKDLHWFVDGELFMTYVDSEPIRGRSFGFNDWDTPVQFDNVAVYDLGK
jgi:hypothetical protein